MDTGQCAYSHIADLWGFGQICSRRIQNRAFRFLVSLFIAQSYRPYSLIRIGGVHFDVCRVLLRNARHQSLSLSLSRSANVLAGRAARRVRENPWDPRWPRPSTQAKQAPALSTEEPSRPATPVVESPAASPTRSATARRVLRTDAPECTERIATTADNDVSSSSLASDVDIARTSDDQASDSSHASGSSLQR